MEQDQQHDGSDRESLSQLRDYVTKAVDEIVRLRAQNTSLARRLANIESDSGDGSVTIDGISDPEELRATISGFIDAIDRHLEALDDDEVQDDEDGPDDDSDDETFA